MRPIAERHGLTPLQLACQWNLAHEPVALRRADADPGARRRRAADRATSAPSSPRVPARVVLSDDEVAEIRAIGDNTGSMALKGAAPRPRGRRRSRTAGRSTPSSPSSPRRWGIDPARDLAKAAAA